MNLAKPLTPLPQALHQPREGANRRRRVGDRDIDPDALWHFNELLGRIDLTHPRLDPDQVATAARELADGASPSGWAESILQRMRRAAAIDRMLADPEWIPEDSAEAAALVVAYLHDDHPLIPNTVPVVGRLDDVIVVDASWPQIAQEVRDYLDFSRLRRIEAALRREPRRYFGFSREAWLGAREAEAEWVAHRHLVNTSRYADEHPDPRFRIH